MLENKPAEATLMSPVPSPGSLHCLLAGASTLLLSFAAPLEDYSLAWKTSALPVLSAGTALSVVGLSEPHSCRHQVTLCCLIAVRLT